RRSCVVQAARLPRYQRVGAAARVEASLPQRFARVDVADTSDPRLIQQEVLQRTLGRGEQCGKAVGGEIAREGVDAQGVEARAIINGFPEVKVAKMAAIGEAEDAFVQFEGNIDVHAVFTLVGALPQFLAVRKP